MCLIVAFLCPFLCLTVCFVEGVFVGGDSVNYALCVACRCVCYVMFIAVLCACLLLLLCCYFVFVVVFVLVL